MKRIKRREKKGKKENEIVFLKFSSHLVIKTRHLIIFKSRVFFLTAREFGNGFGSFGNGVLSQFTREQQFDCSLNFSGAQSSFFVISHQFAGFHG